MEKSQSTYDSFMEAYYICLKENYDPNNKDACLEMADTFISMAGGFYDALKNQYQEEAKSLENDEREKLLRRINDLKRLKKEFKRIKATIEADGFPPGTKQADEAEIRKHAEKLACRFKMEFAA
jgi:hypothetical protein